VADAIARARRALGEDVFFLTGLDEHGQKVQQAAMAEGKLRAVVATSSLDLGILTPETRAPRYARRTANRGTQDLGSIAVVGKLMEDGEDVLGRQVSFEPTGCCDGGSCTC